MPLNNFGTVTERHGNFLYRSAQPDWNGYDDLEQLGVTHVFQLNFKDFANYIPNHTELKFTRYGMVPAGKPHDETIKQIVNQIDEAMKLGDVLVHCTFGRDRTGLVIAAFRILKEGWTYPEAYDEMQRYSTMPIGKPGYFDEDFLKYLYTLYLEQRTDDTTGSTASPNSGPELGALVPASH